jgi:hypothetical protein
MPRRVRTQVSTSPGRQPFKSALAQLQSSQVSTFAAAEPTFRMAMEQFDQLVASGQTDQGDRQNGKGDFFNDVLHLILERCSGKQLHSRPNIPGLLFRRHMLDIAYPATGTVELTIETKATGIPKHPRSQQQHPTGRAGSADLDKRIKEAAFKDVDIKGEYSRTLGRGGGATSDLMSWLGRTPPRNWLLMSCRVRDAGDLQRTIDFAQIASRWFEACGVYVYGHQHWDLMKPLRSAVHTWDRTRSSSTVVGTGFAQQAGPRRGTPLSHRCVTMRSR